MCPVARSDERESVRRRNFGQGSEKEQWGRHGRHVKICSLKFGGKYGCTVFLVGDGK